MGLVDFLKKVLVLIGVLLQAFGYVESVFRLTRIPYTFLITTAGYVALAVFLVWCIWISHDYTFRQKRIGLVCFVLLSIAYYTFTQYALMLVLRKDAFRQVVALDSARSLVSRDPEETLLQLSKVKGELSEIPEKYNIRGTAYYRLGRYGDAYNDYKKASELDPENRQYVYNMAVALREMCDFKGALEIFDTYLKNYKDDVWGYFDRGVIHHMMREYDKALADYGVVVANKKDTVESALFNTGAVYALKYQADSDEDVRKQDLRQTISYLEQSIKMGGQTRVSKIREALIPIARRPPRCEGYYLTDDLMGVANAERFKEWLQAQ